MQLKMALAAEMAEVMVMWSFLLGATRFLNRNVTGSKALTQLEGLHYILSHAFNFIPKRSIQKGYP